MTLKWIMRMEDSFMKLIEQSMFIGLAVCTLCITILLVAKVLRCFGWIDL